MAKNILIFSDGTGQSGGLKPDQCLSNVYKLYKATRVGPDNNIDPAKQIAFYDPGLGSGTADSAWVWLKKTWSSVTGSGFTKNVADCYEAILQHYEPGDRIYIFGFSRGAYTARSVAGVLNLCGVPKSLPDGTAIPKYGNACRLIANEAVHDVYEHGAGKPRQLYEDEREEKAKRFRKKYNSESDHPNRGNVAPYFIGVFDTVAALGLTGFKKHASMTILLGSVVAVSALFAWLASNYFGLNALISYLVIIAVIGIYGLHYIYQHRLKTIQNFPKKGDFKYHFSSWKFSHYDRFLDPRVKLARHAQAIDEDRADFDRVGWGSTGEAPTRTKNDPLPLIQMWFPGNHSDIGGSYPENESRLSDIALSWMIKEAITAPNPILIDNSKINLFPDPLGMQHCEVEAVYDLFPSWWPEFLRKSWKKKLRKFGPGYTRHPSVDKRIAAKSVSRLGRSIKYDPFGLRNNK